MKKSARCGLLALLIVASITSHARSVELGPAMFAGPSHFRHDLDEDRDSEYSGVAVAVDYQYPLHNDLTLNPFYRRCALREGAFVRGGNSGARGSSALEGELNLSALGMQLRRYVGRYFVGFLSAMYRADLTSSAFSGVPPPGKGSGLGYGVVSGYAFAGGLELVLMLDTVTIDRTDFLGFAAVIGYRFS